jgi:multicomponent Na+:H+ antiporter subunit E
MNRLLFNILLALLWAAVTGSFSPGTLIFGFIVGYLALLLAQPMLGPSAYYTRLWRATVYAVLFVWDLLRSSVIVAYDVLTPGLAGAPAVVAVPLEVRSSVAITLLANTISLTPGTLSLDVSDDRSTLYVHSMYHGDDLDRIRADIKRVEARVKALVEPEIPDAPAG